jgi:hypothetical protein
MSPRRATERRSRRPTSIELPRNGGFIGARADRPLSNLQGRFNPAVADISYRSNQGSSNYNAFTAVARYRAYRTQVKVFYTWSHVIDNQSEPLAGEFFDLR